MARFRIRGGNPLNGRFQPAGNKNAALPMLAACLLTDEPVTLHNVPFIQDVEVMLQLLSALGVEVRREGTTVSLEAAGVKATELDPDLCRRVRASILLAGPLVGRYGSATFVPPGGDVIGRRRLDTHFYGLTKMGCEVSLGERFRLHAERLRGAELLLDEASVTATENILMAAALAEGVTTLYHAACEPHVQDLCELLVRMGARIEGQGTNRIRVEGVSRLHGAECTVGSDYVEVGSFLAAAAATGGALTVQGQPDDLALRILGRSFQKLGIVWQFEGDVLRLPAEQTRAIQKDLASAIPKIEDGIWPAFPSDLMSVAIVLATQCTGSLLFFEKMFESRMYFVDRLIEMGAQIVQCDPHRVLVQGPAALHATHMSSPDIRAGMALVIAALCARGESVIDNVAMIDRGYERVDERLRMLGADIERIA